MVTLYGPDTLNMLRSASETLNLASASSSQVSNNKKWQRQQLQELLKKNENAEDSDLQTKVQNWFKALSVPARYSAVSHEAPLICTFIWQMFIKKLSEGEVNYTFKVRSAKYFDTDNFDNNFSVEKKSPRSQSISSVEFQVEKSFEKSIRLTDSHEYLDTLTLETDLLTDIDKFFDYVRMLSGGKSFKVPCQVCWDSSLKVWIWDYPAWFNCYSCLPLAAWACASIEKAIWAAYWTINNIDPTNTKSLVKNFHFKESHTLSSQLLENLLGYFKEIKQKEKESLTGTKELISNDFIFVKNQLNKFSTKCISYINMPKSATLYPSSHLCFPFYPHPLTSLYSYTEKANIKFNQSPESINTIHTKLSAGNDQKFLEFLMNTPLERAVTLLDIVIRKVLYRITNAYSEKNALELLQNEPLLLKDSKPNEKLKKSKKSKKNKRKRSQKNPKSLEKSTTPEEHEKVQDLIKETLNSLLENAFKVIENKEKLRQESKTEGFQEVFSQKNKRRMQPQQAQTPKKRANKHSRKYPKPVQSIKPPPPAPSSSSEPEAKTVQTPPSFNIFDKLHKEIIEFGKSRTWKLETKISRINKVLEKLTEILCVAFTTAGIELFGSYASGLAIEESDVDLVVTRLEFTERIQLEMACEYLAKVIESSKLASKIECIPTARIPVIKLEVNTKAVNLGEGIINIDITFDDSLNGNFGTHLGLSTLYLTIELQKIYPSLQYLVLVIKKLLYKQELNSSYRGGLSSYSLVIWVAALLNSMPVVPENLGKLLCEFLKYFGTEFDPSKIGVNIMNGGSFFELENPGCEAVVTIDPVNLLNNTRMAYRIPEVLSSFKWAYEALHTHESGKNKKVLYRIFSKGR